MVHIQQTSYPAIPGTNNQSMFTFLLLSVTPDSMTRDYTYPLDLLHSLAGFTAIICLLQLPTDNSAPTLSHRIHSMFTRIYVE